MCTGFMYSMFCVIFYTYTYLIHMFYKLQLCVFMKIKLSSIFFIPNQRIKTKKILKIHILENCVQIIKTFKNRLFL